MFPNPKQEKNKLQRFQKPRENIVELFGVLQRSEARGGRGKNVGKALTTPAAQEGEVTRGTSQGENDVALLKVRLLWHFSG